MWNNFKFVCEFNHLFILQQSMIQEFIRFDMKQKLSPTSDHINTNECLIFQCSNSYCCAYTGDLLFVFAIVFLIQFFILRTTLREFKQAQNRRNELCKNCFIYFLLKVRIICQCMRN